jgi:hypothetical protein
VRQGDAFRGKVTLSARKATLSARKTTLFAARRRF